MLFGIAYYILERLIIVSQGTGSLLRRAVGGDWKNLLSVLFYIIGIVVACWSARLAQGLYVMVALMWLIPDRRIERQLHDGQPQS